MPLFSTPSGTSPWADTVFPAPSLKIMATGKDALAKAIADFASGDPDGT